MEASVLCFENTHTLIVYNVVKYGEICSDVSNASAPGSSSLLIVHHEQISFPVSEDMCLCFILALRDFLQFSPPPSKQIIFKLLSLWRVCHLKNKFILNIFFSSVHIFACKLCSHSKANLLGKKNVCFTSIFGTVFKIAFFNRPLRKWMVIPILH